MPTDAALAPFLAAARDIARRGLLSCSSGNLSWRLDGERYLISASRSWLERLTAADVVVCRLADGAALEGGRPSVESAFHAALLRQRPEWNVVLHHQSPAATAVCCGDRPEWSLNVLPEVPFYIGTVARVPFRIPGSHELHEAVAEAGRTAGMLLLENHGLVTGGRDFDDAIQKAVFFELNCDLLLRDPGVRRLSPEAVAELRASGERARQDAGAQGC